MNKIGVCSITFRNLSIQELIEATKRANLDAIEWGSDVHVIPNDVEHAKKVGDLTKKAGLDVSSCGTYYRVGIENKYSFEEILECAIALRAKDIRVWAGRRGSREVESAYFDAVVEDSRRIAQLASDVGIRVSYEYHGKTLTDTVDSALRLLKAVNHENIYIYWQPAINLDVKTRLSNIKAIAPYLTNIHVFNWKKIDRLPLKTGIVEWKRYFEEISQSPSLIDSRYYLLEFVKEDSLDQFFEDAEALIKIVKS